MPSRSLQTENQNLARLGLLASSRQPSLSISLPAKAGGGEGVEPSYQFAISICYECTGKILAKLEPHAQEFPEL